MKPAILVVDDNTTETFVLLAIEAVSDINSDGPLLRQNALILLQYGYVQYSRSVKMFSNNYFFIFSCCRYKKYY